MRWYVHNYIAEVGENVSIGKHIAEGGENILLWYFKLQVTFKPVDIQIHFKADENVLLLCLKVHDAFKCADA
jgi:hypothetical protein